MTIRRLLVANRGEIALRVIRTARRMGLETVAVCSAADRLAPHALSADFCVEIGPAPALESYLDVDRVMAAVRQSGADAVHPGYGFLSENVRLQRALAAEGLTFIGPGERAIFAMGDKAIARQTAVQAGVSPVPGHDGSDDEDELRLAAERIGYPLLVKAAMGGGGKGMRRVTAVSELGEALRAARREAMAAFGDGKLLLERYVERARHIEIQLLADQHGRVLPVFERECSLQRRHQKVIEECPSAAVSPDLRTRMGAAAVRLAEAVGYLGAGTVEFLLEESGDFWFLEMNTRLQVEHPVTESCSGLDLVEWQIRIANGEALPADLVPERPRGHAIEARIYAEDPAAGFLPQAGLLKRLRWPTGPGIRVDAGFEEGMEVPSDYDPMLAKIIASGRTREEARERLLQALKDTAILGLRANLHYLISLLESELFRSAQTFTRSLEAVQYKDPEEGAMDACLLAAVALSLERPQRAHSAQELDADVSAPFRRLGPLRIVPGANA